MAIGDGFRNGYCILFLASTFAIAFAIQNFLQDRCCSFPDDVIDFVPYRICVAQCLEMDGCKAISYKQVMSACKMHFQECDPTETCEYYVFARRANLTLDGLQDEPPGKFEQCSSYVKKCPSLRSPWYGKLLGNRFSEGSKVKVVCNPGYILNGSDQRTCQNGQWTGDEASCEEDPACKKPLLWDNDGVERTLTESSTYCTVNNDAQCGGQECNKNSTYVSSLYSRINSTGPLTGSWMAGTRSSSEYIQVMFHQARTVAAIVLQGRDHCPCCDGNQHYVTNFTIDMSFNGRHWTTVTDDNGEIKYFEGTTEWSDIVVRRLPERKRTPYVRLHPQEWNNHPSLRWDILGC